jgi:tRNA-dihydrouridine synthase
MTNFWNELPQPFFILAPMEAVTDVVFRHVVARAGAPDIWFSEFTNATGWVHAGQKAIGGRLVRTEDENPIVAQIWGGEPGDMEQLAAHCRELGFHGIDINMGCPAKSAIKSGGSALIRKPEVAVAAIAAAKTAGLPVSVKTRLGYTHADEWKEWLTTLLAQDIVNLTIHLRTKKEMSKVAAHFELIDDIVRLRDDIAPRTLLTINGDIMNRAHGEQLVREHPGVNGVMIGRGIFQDPFAFRADPSSHPTNHPTSQARSPQSDLADASWLATAGKAEPSRGEVSGVLDNNDSTTGTATHTSLKSDAYELPEASAQARGASEATSLRSEDCLSGASSAAAREGDEQDARRAEAVSGKLIARSEGDKNARKASFISLLHFHLDLFDTWQSDMHRPFETLKRFFKIYIRDFDGAKDLRDQLMHCTSTDDVRNILKHH